MAKRKPDRIPKWPKRLPQSPVSWRETDYELPEEQHGPMTAYLNNRNFLIRHPGFRDEISRLRECYCVSNGNDEARRAATNSINTAYSKAMKLISARFAKTLEKFGISMQYPMICAQDGLVVEAYELAENWFIGGTGGGIWVEWLARSWDPRKDPSPPFSIEPEGSRPIFFPWQIQIETNFPAQTRLVTLVLRSGISKKLAIEAAKRAVSHVDRRKTAGRNRHSIPDDRLAVLFAKTFGSAPLKEKPKQLRACFLAIQKDLQPIKHVSIHTIRREFYKWSGLFPRRYYLE